MLANSRKQENYFPLEAHQYNITAFAPATAGGDVLWGCKPSGCEAGGAEPPSPAQTQIQVPSHRREAKSWESTGAVWWGQEVYSIYLPSLSFPTLAAFSHNCFQCVIAVKEITVISALSRDCRTPCLHTVTPDPGELPQVNIVVCLCSRVFHSLWLFKACEYLSCQIQTCTLKI